MSDTSETQPGNTLNELALVLAIAAVLIMTSYFVWKYIPAPGPSLSGSPAGELAGSEALDDFEQAMDDAIVDGRLAFKFYLKIHAIIQFYLILFALIATVFASLTTGSNAPTLKRYSVFLTATTAALTGVLSTFHVKENAISMIDAQARLNALEINYLGDRAKYDPELVAMKKDEVIFKKYHKNETYFKYFPAGVTELQRRYADCYVRIQADRLRAYASVGQQSEATRTATNSDDCRSRVTDSASEVKAPK